MSIEDDLRRIPALRDLPEPELAVLAFVVSRRDASAGEVLIQQGAPSRSCFFLVRGEVEVRKTIAGSPRLLNTLDEGTTFGQIGLVDGGPRSASVVARTPVVVLELRRADYDNLLSSGRLAGLRVQEAVARAAIRQLRTATHRLALLEARNQARELENVRHGLCDWDVDVLKVEVVKTGLPKVRYPR